MVKIVLDKIKTTKVNEFDTDFFHDEDYTFEFEDGSSIMVKFGEMSTWLFNWYFCFKYKQNGHLFYKTIYQSYNPFVKMWVMYVVRKRYYELVKEMLNK